MTKDEAMPFHVANLAIKKVEEDLAQPEQEPSFWMDSLDIEHRTPTIITNEDKREGHLSDWRCIHPVYTAPPQRTWVGLTDEEIDGCDWGQSERDHAKAVEAKLKEKNT